VSGTLHIGLTSTGSTVLLSRSAGLADELWNALSRTIAPGDALDSANDAIAVPVERFLASRNAVASLLQVHNCAAEFEDNITSLLSRGDAEREEVSRLLAGQHRDAAPDDLPALLRGGRFTRRLMPFQERDLRRLLSLSHGANFSVPGAGKTTVAYACYEVERLNRRVDRLLVVAPLSAFDAWMSEAVACLSPAPHIARLDGRVTPSTEVLLLNYQRLASRYKDVAAWCVGGSCHIILDEAHRMKRGRTGEWGAACLDLAHLAVRRDILTGTPAPQHPRDFLALLDFIWPHQARRILPPAALLKDPTPDVMVAVSHRLEPLFVRTKKDELGLDPPLLRVERVEMKPLQAEIYDALRTRMRHSIRSSARERALFGHIGEVVMYMLEASTNPALLSKAVANAPPSRMSWPPVAVPADTTLATRVLEYGKYEVPRKFEKLAALVASNTELGRKTLVWSNFVSNLDELAHHVLAPFHPALIYGAIPSTAEDADFVTRETELRRFREDDRCMVLLANPAAMSEGVSLHDVCHDAVYVDRTFNGGQYLQSLDRIHRLGLPPGTETRITFLVSAGTVDEVVDQRLSVKAERLSQMLSDPNLVAMALPDEESYGEWIDPDDLDALFEHLGEHGA
jgi:SNF2 family DNA or RNA helicase